jgi:hypothetical protein
MELETPVADATGVLLSWNGKKRAGARDFFMQRDRLEPTFAWCVPSFPHLHFQDESLQPHPFE